MWVDTITEGWWRFMAAWRKEEEDSARLRQEKKEANETWKVVALQGSIEPSKHRRLASKTT